MRYLTQSMMRWMLFAVGGLFITLSTPTFAVTPTLSALVIGNSAYEQDQLPNPENDAKLISETLEKLGFKVTSANNLNRADMFATVREFTQSLKPGAVSLVYYAGHGMQINGGNYLIPVDMVPTSEKGVTLKAYPLVNLMDRLKKSPSAVNLVILDACRNNPFSLKPKTRGFNNMGLAEVVAPRGTLVAYSTQPGQQAEDGQGRNSLYTQTLAQEMTVRGQTIEQTLKSVAKVVRKQTFDDQQPWFETSLVNEFYFKPPVGVEMVTKPVAPVKLAGNETGSVKRGLDLDKRNDNDWYMNLSNAEWNNFDWEIMQRVKRATADEIPVLEHRAKSGNVIAQTTLGVIYREGVEKTTEQGTGRTFRSKANNTKSLYWLMRAAKAGFPMAQVEVGEMHYIGQGVDRNLAKARMWYEKAAEANYPRARLDLAQVKAVASGSDEDMRAMADEMMRNIW